MFDAWPQRLTTGRAAREYKWRETNFSRLSLVKFVFSWPRPALAAVDDTYQYISALEVKKLHWLSTLHLGNPWKILGKILGNPWKILGKSLKPHSTSSPVPDSVAPNRTWPVTHRPKKTSRVSSLRAFCHHHLRSDGLHPWGNWLCRWIIWVWINKLIPQLRSIHQQLKSERERGTQVMHLDSSGWFQTQKMIKVQESTGIIIHSLDSNYSPGNKHGWLGNSWTISMGI